MNYGMAVSNKDWRTDQRYRNVKEALEGAGHKVQVITTDMGWPDFVGVEDVICRHNIEEYVEKVGLGVGPAVVETMAGPPAAGEQVGAGEPPCEPAVTEPEPDLTPEAPHEEAEPPVEPVLMDTITFLASKNAIAFAEEHNIDLADVPHKGEKITLPNVKAFLASRDERNPD